ASYGSAPAFGFKIVQGPVGLPNGRDDDRDGVADEDGERLGLTSAIMHPNAGGPMHDPRTAVEYYRVMQGLWRDGTPITEGGIGYHTGGAVTCFSFPGDPVTAQFWSEENSD